MNKKSTAWLARSSLILFFIAKIDALVGHLEQYYTDLNKLLINAFLAAASEEPKGNLPSRKVGFAHRAVNLNQQHVNS